MPNNNTAAPLDRNNLNNQELTPKNHHQNSKDCNSKPAKNKINITIPALSPKNKTVKNTKNNLILNYKSSAKTKYDSCSNYKTVSINSNKNNTNL